MTEITYTNSSLSCARECLTKYDLKYMQRLERVGDEREALAVGTCWHKAFDAEQQQALAATPGGAIVENAAYPAIEKHAPSPLWNEKLRRLFAAYHWHWKDEPLDFIQSEHTFRVQIGDFEAEGQIDGVIRVGKKRGIIERKTSGDTIDVDALYWKRLRLDVQVGIYALACGFVPDFILYDVAKKPTIKPKAISQKEVARMQSEEKADGSATYFGERFSGDTLEQALVECTETNELYGARLTADIGNRPEFYFARREVHRTTQDFDTLVDNLKQQVHLLEYARENELMHRNPNSCALFGACEMFPLCENNIRPRAGQPAPEGFRVREHLHPELAKPQS